MIETFGNSNFKNKRFRVILNDGKSINFGYELGQTYLDHNDKKLRKNYWARHYANETERTLIRNLVPSPALLSAVLLWGPSINVYDNIEYLNNLWDLKHQNRNFIYEPDFL